MRIARILTYAVPLLALCTIPREASHAQENSVRIEFAGDSARGTVIGAFRRSGTVYVSLNDLAHLFSLPTYESPESQKFEIKRLPMRLKATGGNPFLVVTDSTGRQSAYQHASDQMFQAVDARRPASVIRIDHGVVDPVFDAIEDSVYRQATLASHRALAGSADLRRHESAATRSIVAAFGLGLALVRRLVESLGGQIAVESRLGHGTTFRFTLPVAVAEDVRHPVEVG